MINSGGLDAQVEQRMDAYRNNPQQLKQKYGQNKELLDLLALQKLTSEKQAVARDMQLKMEQQPGTIAQQREQEALQLTKQEMGGSLNELAGRTNSTLGQKNVMQKKNMQRMAQGKPPQPNQGGLSTLANPAQPPARPPMQPPARGGGIASINPQQPRRMASGGIVSFVEGRLVKLSDDQKKNLTDQGLASQIDIIERMQDNSPEYQAMLELIGPKAQSSGFGRLVDDFLGGGTYEENQRQELINQVYEKYRRLGSPVGALDTATPEAREYAKKVLEQFTGLSNGNTVLTNEELQAYLEQDFNPQDDQFDISAPETTTAETINTEAETPPPPEAQSEALVDVLEPPSVRLPVAPEVVTPDQTGVDASFAKLAGLQEQADSARLQAQTATGEGYNIVDAGVVKPETVVAKLPTMEPADTDTFLNAQDQEIERSLLERSAEAAALNPEAYGIAARNEAAGFQNRGEFKDRRETSLAKAQAEYDAMYSPRRRQDMLRMQSASGAGRPGGVGGAYADALQQQNKDVTAGLKSLRDIDTDLINTDTLISGRSIEQGNNVAARTATAKNNALSYAAETVKRNTDISKLIYGHAADLARTNATNEQSANNQGAANEQSANNQDAGAETELNKIIYEAGLEVIGLRLDTLSEDMATVRARAAQQGDIAIADANAINKLAKQTYEQQFQLNLENAKLITQTATDATTALQSHRTLQQEAVKLYQAAITEFLSTDSNYMQLQELYRQALEDNLSEAELLNIQRQINDRRTSAGQMLQTSPEITGILGIIQAYNEEIKILQGRAGMEVRTVDEDNSTIAPPVPSENPPVQGDTR